MGWCSSSSFGFAWRPSLSSNRPGAPGLYRTADGQAGELNPKQLVFHLPYSRVDTALPGGGGYGDPFSRDPHAVLEDVLNGYVSIEAAERDYGVVVHSSRRPDEQVSLPHHFSIDLPATTALRTRRS